MVYQTSGLNARLVELVAVFVKNAEIDESGHGDGLGFEQGLVMLDGRFIVTVQALREGWDCPFAYVLCSLQKLSSATAVEAK